MGAFSRLSVSRSAPFPGERAGKVTNIRIWSWGLGACSIDLILVSPKHLTWEVPTSPKAAGAQGVFGQHFQANSGILGADPCRARSWTSWIPSDSGYSMILCFLQWMGMFSKWHTVTQIVSLSLKLFVNNREVVSLPCVTVPRHGCLIPQLFLLDL